MTIENQDFRDLRKQPLANASLLSPSPQQPISPYQFPLHTPTPILYYKEQALFVR